VAGEPLFAYTASVIRDEPLAFLGKCRIKEFDLKPTDTGKVTVTITVTPPQPDAQAKVTKIEFEVK
jgi:hypothetical protein